MRLIKATDEYGGGVATYYQTSKAMLDTGFHLLMLLEEDLPKLSARDLHELLRAWENYHRLWTVRPSHTQHIAVREESRYPRLLLSPTSWAWTTRSGNASSNSRFDPATNETTFFRDPISRSFPTNHNLKIGASPRGRPCQSAGAA